MNPGKMVDLTRVLMTLMTEGFVRVDGLRCKPICGDEYIIAQGTKCADKAVIKWDGNNGLLVVVVPTGSVWVRSRDDGRSADIIHEIRKRATGILVEQGCHVPLSNGEDVSTRDILRRVSNPDWIPDYHTTEEAHKAGF